MNSLSEHQRFALLKEQNNMLKEALKKQASRTIAPEPCGICGGLALERDLLAFNYVCASCVSEGMMISSMRDMRSKLQDALKQMDETSLRQSLADILVDLEIKIVEAEEKQGE
jgi:hypothetical protein